MATVASAAAELQAQVRGGRRRTSLAGASVSTVSKLQRESLPSTDCRAELSILLMLRDAVMLDLRRIVLVTLWRLTLDVVLSRADSAPSAARNSTAFLSQEVCLRLPIDVLRVPCSLCDDAELAGGLRRSSRLMAMRSIRTSSSAKSAGPCTSITRSAVSRICDECR